MITTGRQTTQASHSSQVWVRFARPTRSPTKFGFVSRDRRLHLLSEIGMKGEKVCGPLILPIPSKFGFVSHDFTILLPFVAGQIPCQRLSRGRTGLRSLNSRIRR